MDALANEQKLLVKRQDGQDGRMTDLERTVQALKAELEAAKIEIALTKAKWEKKKRRWWPFSGP